PVELHEAVALHRMPVNGQDHVPLPDKAVACSARDHVADEDALAIIRQAEGAALSRVYQREGSEREVHVSVVMAVLNILEETFDDGDGDHVADVLGDIAAVALKGDADHLPLLHDGAAAVARIDGGVGLDGEMG